MALNKLKFEKGFFGGNMEALECVRNGFQILLSDGFGNIPKEYNEEADIPASDWSFSFYKKTSSGDFDENPIFSSDTYSDYNEKEAESFIRKTFAEFLETRN